MGSAATSNRLAAAFQGARGAEETATAEIDAAITAAWQAARAAWPGVELDAETFAAHLGRHANPAHETDDAIARLHASDLYLACACAHADPTAVRVFLARVRPVVDTIAARFANTGLTRDEAQQLVSVHLLVPDDDAEPRIARYAGRGALLGWVRVAVSRLLIDRVRARDVGDVSTSDAALIALMEPGLDVERAVLQQRHREQVRGALEAAIASLDHGARVLLRLRFVHGLELHDIARMQGVHRVTISKRIARTRDALLSAVRRELAAALDTSRFAASTLDELVAACRSQLELSLARLLASSGGE